MSPPTGPAQLTLSDHVHDFVAPQRSPGRVKEAESQTGLYPAFDKPVILLDDVIQVLARTQCAGLGNHTFLVQGIEGTGIGGISIDIDHPWR